MKKMMMQVLSVLLCVALLVPPMAPRAKAAITRETIASFFDDVSFYYGLAKDVLELGGVVLDINYDELSSPTDIKGTVWETGTGWMGDVSRYVEVDDVALSVFARDLHDEFGYTGLSFYLTTISGYGKSYRVVACDGMNEATLKPITYIFTLDGIVLCAPVGDEPLPDIWIPLEDIGTRFVMLSYPDFYNKVAENAGAGCDPEDHILTYGNDKGKKFIAYSVPDRDRVLARSDGSVYATPYDPSMLGINQNRPSTEGKDENGNEITIEPGANVGIDMENGTITLEDGSVLEMIQNTYDESTKTYYVDARTYIDEGDTYIYNTYQYTYHINYTSITYIGQTEEYNKYYEVYYELPDGRSSADLTAEDLEQLNVSVDVIPYGRSADDTSLRSLYHFDGDTKDSSYWNYCTDFTWNKGASLTYMDAGVFDGALYLDENEHDFTVKLPSRMVTTDWLIEFRYYQSHTPAPQNDSYIKFGSTTLLQLNGGAFVFGSVSTTAPIGQWCSLAFQRIGGSIYFYLNGVTIGSVNTSAIFEDEIIFHFGSDQQTFKYLDELRVVRRALYDATGYEPSSVPFDTNLTLVLPDSKIPVADAYWKFSSTRTNMLSQYGMADWTALEKNSYFKRFSQPLYWNHQINGWYNLRSNLSPWASYKYPNWGVNTDLVSCSTTAEGVQIFAPSQKVYYAYGGSASSLLSFYSYTHLDDNSSTPLTGGYYPYGAVTALADVTLSSPFQGAVSYKTGSSYIGFGSFVFSICLDDGSVVSLPFALTSGGTPVSKEVYGGGYVLGCGPVYDSQQGICRFCIYVSVTGSSTSNRNILYAELAKASTTDLTAEYVEAVTIIDSDCFNTPTLAVRTDLDITRYQIGGPRPSIPQKGLVWALVENDRIASIQIYNGSAWEGVDGRIWTGERWIPASSFNIITLQDMYDIVDATQDFEYIYSESGFWAWWQRSWNDFTKMIDDRLKAIINALGGSAGSGEIEKPDEEGKSKFSLGQLLGKVTSAIASVPAAALTGLVSVVSDLVGAFVESISEFSTGLSDLLDVFHSFGLVAAEGEDGDGGILPQAAGIAQLTKGAFAALPSDLQTMFTISFFMLIIVGIIRLLI